jgi:hypothetical protein
MTCFGERTLSLICSMSQKLIRTENAPRVRSRGGPEQVLVWQVPHQTNLIFLGAGKKGKVFVGAGLCLLISAISCFKQ